MRNNQIFNAPIDIDDAVIKKHLQNADTALGAQTENLNMNNHRITGVVDPTGDKDAATKKYVDDNMGIGEGEGTGKSTGWGVHVRVSDAVYSTDWNGVTTIAPSKNAVYDKIETMGSGGGGGGGSEKTLHFSDYYTAGGSGQTATDLNTALTAATGKILVIDGGNSTVYTFKGIINVPANTTVEGDGAWLKWDMDSQCGITLNGSGNITLRHLFLDVSNPLHNTTANTTSHGIFVQGPHCRILDCYMKGSATHADVAIRAIYLGDYSDNSYLVIKDNYFKQTYWTIARFNSTWNDGGAHPSPMGKISYAKITGNHFVDVLADGIEINLGEDDVGVDISFNTMNGVHRQDAGPNGLAIGIAGWDNDDAGAPPENEVQRHFKIEGNIIRNADYVGIHVEQCHNFIINDNFVYNAGSTGLEGGIVVWGGSYEFEITNNHLKECEYGIRVSWNWAGGSWCYNINGNTVIDCGSYGIHAESGTANNLSVIRGNQILDSGEDGIYVLTGASDWNITNNTVNRAGAYSFDINYENASNTVVLSNNSSTNPWFGNLTESNGGSATIRELGNSWNTDIEFADNGKAVFGTDNDMKIYHSGGYNYISSYNPNGFVFYNGTDSESMLSIAHNEGVHLYYNGVLKAETTNTGVLVTGNVIAPSQPAFSAYITADQLNKTGDTTQYNITGAIWTERFDQNANFLNGTFTAPVTGKYLFTGTINMKDIGAAHTSMQADLIASNHNDTLVYCDPKSMCAAGYLTTNFSAFVDMDANDTAALRITVSGGTKVIDIRATHTTFQGTLIC